MPIGTISLKYATKKFPVSKTFDTRVNVKDAVEYLRYSTVFDDTSVGVSFIDSPKVNVDDNILIKDTSALIESNKKDREEETIFLEDSFVTPFSRFSITDVIFNINGEDVPFYLRHDLSHIQDPQNIELLDGNFEPVDPDLWKYLDETVVLEEESRHIYTNLKCNLSKRDSSYEVFYLRYKDGATGQLYNELLNSKEFYQQASFISDRKSREFIISTIGNEFQIDVVFDSLNYSPTKVSGTQRFSIKTIPSGKVYVEKPTAISTEERWNLRVSPGDFNLGTSRYWVPEYWTQLYSPTYPYRLIKERKATLVAPNLVYSSQFPIANLGIDGYYVYLIIKDENDQLRRALTNDPEADLYITKDGFITDTYYEKDVIKSISSNSGFILLNENLKSTDKVYITCRYIEEFLTYEALSVNPSINPGVLGKRIIMYIKPNASDRAIHHLVAENNGVISEASESLWLQSYSGIASNGGLDVLYDSELGIIDYYSGYELEILSGKNSGVKQKILSFDPADFSIKVSMPFPEEIAEGTTYRILKKVQDYQTHDETLNHTFFYTGWEGRALANNDKKLADVFVTQTLNVNDITSFDSRIKGGGIKEENLQAALQIQDEVRWYWDVGNFDGDPYPGMSAILVELPRSILKEIGGPFDRDQVEEIVLKHMAEGSYPVIKYYDKSTEIIDVEPTDGEVYLKWRKISASQYNIYMGNSPDNVEKIHSQPGTRDEYLITGLENNKIYYFQIEPVVGGIERLRSRIVAAMPFNHSDTLPPMKYGEGIFLGGSYD